MADVEDKELLDHEIKSKQQREEQKRAVWSALEHEGSIPAGDDLGHFSNLLQEDINRAEKLWPRLPTDVRRDLVRTLSEVADANVVMDFTAVYLIGIRDADPDIRATAVEALREVEDVHLVPAFIELLHHDPAARVRQAAASVLANFVLLGELEKIRRGTFEAVVLALRDRHDDVAEDPGVRRHAMESLAYTGEHDVPAMIAAAYADGDAEMRRSAVVAMGRSADKRWGVHVRRELNNPSPDMRLEATRASGELQLRAAVREIVELVEDTDSRIRAAALWSLGQIGGNLARKTLQRYSDAEDESLSEVAEQALQELEFFYGDLSSFFGPPSEYDGESEELWKMPGLGDLPDDEDEPYIIGVADDSEDVDAGDDDELYLSEDDEDEDLLDRLALIEALDDDDDDDDDEDEEDWN